MLFIAVNSPNLARQHWEGKKTAKRPNNFDWDCCIAEVHQPTQDKRYKNGVSLCGFPPTVEQGTTWISHGRGFWNQRPQSRGMVWWAFMWAVCSKAFRNLYFIRQIRKHLSEDATKVLVHARLCNISSRPLQLPALWFWKYQRDRLQKILGSCTCPHCLLGTQVQSPHTSLYNLHCLPVP